MSMTPREIVHELDKHIIGQSAAKRAAPPQAPCAAPLRAYSRIRARRRLLLLERHVPHGATHTKARTHAHGPGACSIQGREESQASRCARDGEGRGAFSRAAEEAATQDVLGRGRGAVGRGAGRAGRTAAPRSACRAAAGGASAAPGRARRVARTWNGEICVAVYWSVPGTWY